MTKSPKDLIARAKSQRTEELINNQPIETDPISDTAQNQTLLDQEEKKESSWLRWYVAKQSSKMIWWVASNLAEKAVRKNQYDKTVWNTEKEQMAELWQKVANVQWQWVEYAQQQIENQQKRAEVIQKLSTPTANKIFKEYWQSVDWNTTYLTNWKAVLTQPTVHTIDWTSTLWQAYDTVVDAMQKDGVVPTAEQMRELFPEYSHINDETLNYFIGWVLNDMLYNKERTPIEQIANVMWSMSLVDWYTMKFDDILDLMTDELFVKFWIPQDAWQDEGTVEWIHALETLKTYADWINEVWANMEWLSQWTTLQTYRDELPEVDKALSIIEKYPNQYTNKLFDTRTESYKSYIEDRKIEWETMYDWQTILNDLNTDINKDLENSIDKFVTNRAKSIAETTQEEWTQNLRLIRRILYWNYYKDDNWDYYDLTGELMAYTKDWKTYTPDGKEINMDNYRIWFIRAYTNTLLWLSQSVTETISDIDKTTAAYDLWVNPALKSQYITEVVWDAISAAFETLMLSPAWAEFQAATQIPGGIWWSADKLFQWVAGLFGFIFQALWNVTTFTDWWTEEWKNELREIWWNLWIIITGRSIKTFKKSKRWKATEKAIRAWVDKFLEKMWLNSNWTQTLKEALERWNIKNTSTLESLWLKWVPWADGTIEKWKWNETKETTNEKTEPVIEWWPEKKTVKEQVVDKVKVTQVAIQEAYKAMVDTYKKEMWIKDTPQEETTKFAQEVEQNWWDATEVKQFNEDVSKASQKATWTETPSEMEQVKQTAETIKNNVVDNLKPKENREIDNKLEKRLNKMKITDKAKTTLQTNPLVWLLSRVLENLISREYNEKKRIQRQKKWQPMQEKDVDQYLKQEKTGKWDIQDMILEPRYKSVQVLMDNLKWWTKRIHDAIYNTLPRIKIVDFSRFWSELGEWKWKIAEFIAKWEIEIYKNKKWELKARYSGWDTTMDVMVSAAIKVLNEALKEYNTATKNWTMKLSEKNILDIKDRIRKIWYDENSGKPKNWDEATIARELANVYTDFYDRNNLAPNLRKWEKAFQKYYEIFELLEWIIDSNGEIKEQARTKLLWLDSAKIAQIEQLLPGTENFVDLAKYWPEILDLTTKQLTKIVFKHPIAASAMRYGVMMWVANLLFKLPGWRLYWIPVWNALWKLAKARFKQLPEHEMNKKFFDAIAETPEEKAELERMQRDINASYERINNIFKQILEWESNQELPKTWWPDDKTPPSWWNGGWNSGWWKSKETPKEPEETVITKSKKEDTKTDEPITDMADWVAQIQELDTEMENKIMVYADKISKQLEKTYKRIEKTKGKDKADKKMQQILKAVTWLTVEQVKEIMTLESNKMTRTDAMEIDIETATPEQLWEAKGAIQKMKSTWKTRGYTEAAMDKKIEEIEKKEKETQVQPSEEKKSEAKENKVEQQTKEEEMLPASEWDVENELEVEYAEMELRDLLQIKPKTEEETQILEEEKKARKWDIVDNPKKVLKESRKILEDENATPEEIKFYRELIEETRKTAEMDTEMDDRLTDIDTELEKKESQGKIFSDADNKPSILPKPKFKRDYELIEEAKELAAKNWTHRSEEFNRLQIMEAMKDPRWFVRIHNWSRWIEIWKIANIFNFYRELPEEQKAEFRKETKKWLRGRPYWNMVTLASALENAIDTLWYSKGVEEKYNYIVWEKPISKWFKEEDWNYWADDWYRHMWDDNVIEPVTNKDIQDFVQDVRWAWYLLDINIANILNTQGEKLRTVAPDKVSNQWNYVISPTRWRAGNNSLGYFDDEYKTVATNMNKSTTLHEITHQITYNEEKLHEYSPDGTAWIMTKPLEIKVENYSNILKEMNWQDTIEKNSQLNNYYKTPTEYKSRMMEMYLADMEGWKELVEQRFWDALWYRKWDLYEKEIKPLVEKEMIKPLREKYWRNPDKLWEEAFDDLVKEWYYDEPSENLNSVKPSVEQGEKKWKVFHVTQADFEKFKDEFSSSNTSDRNIGFGTFFSDNMEFLEWFKKIKDADIADREKQDRKRKVIDMDSKKTIVHPVNIRDVVWYEKADQIIKEYRELVDKKDYWEAAKKQAEELGFNTVSESLQESYFEGESSYDHRGWGVEEEREILRKKWYDAVMFYEWKVNGRDVFSYAIFEPNKYNIKTDK